MKDIVTIIGTLIGGYYALYSAFLDNLNFFTLNQNDYTRLKFDLYSFKKYRKNRLYTSLAFIVLTVLVTSSFTKDVLRVIIVSYIFVIIYILIQFRIDTKRNKKVLTIEEKGIIWYLHFRIDSEYYFSTEENKKKLKDELTFRMLKKEDILKYKPKYEFRSVIPLREKLRNCICGKNTLETTDSNEVLIAKYFTNKIDGSLTENRIKAKKGGKEEYYINEVLQPILDEAANKIKATTIDNIE